MSEITTLPKWKVGATAYERLSELALMAREQPEKFEKFAIVYMEKRPTGNIKLRTMGFTLGGRIPNYMELMGLLEAGKMHEWESSKA